MANNDSPTMAQLAEAWEQIGAAADRVGAVIQAQFERLMPSLAQLVAASRQHYLDAGAPYGESDAGMQRYYDELHTIRQYEHEIERIRDRHATLAMLRRKRLARKHAASEAELPE